MNIPETVKIIDQCYQALLRKNEKYITKIAQLTALGCINGKEYWKDGKYLYLLRPMTNGRRLKTYVGNHPNNIKDARSKILNYKERTQYIHLQDKVLKEIIQIEKVLASCLELCSRSSTV